VAAHLQQAPASPESVNAVAVVRGIGLHPETHRQAAGQPPTRRPPALEALRPLRSGDAAMLEITATIRLDAFLPAAGCCRPR